MSSLRKNDDANHEYQHQVQEAPPATGQVTPPCTPTFLTRRDLSRSASDYYAPSLTSMSTPKAAMRMSSLRRTPYDPHLIHQASNSPQGSFGTPAMYKSWIDRLHNNVNLDDSLVAYEAGNEYLPEEEFQQYSTRLQKKLRNEEQRLEEAKASIIQYRNERDTATYSWNEVCAHALLLISNMRLCTYRQLVKRIEVFHRMNHGPPPLAVAARTTFDIFNIVVPLSPQFYMEKSSDNTSYVFLIIGSTNEKISATQLVQVSSKTLLKNKHFRIDEHMKFSNLPLNFCIEFTIYCLKITSRLNTTPKRVAKVAAKFLAKLSSSAASLNASIGSKTAEDIEDATFQSAGWFLLSRSSVGTVSTPLHNSVFPLDCTPYTKVNVSCVVSPLPEVLNVDWKGAWILLRNDGHPYDPYIVRMIHGIISFYHPSEDGHKEDPKFIIDCSTICNREIERADPFSDEHPYVFGLEVITFPRGSEFIEQREYLVSVATEEKLYKWMEVLNECLRVIQAAN